MAAKPVINFIFFFFKSFIEIYTEKERVISHRKGRHLMDDAADGEDMMDVAVRNHQESKTRIEDKFAAAQDNVKNSESRLDELFKEAKEKAKDIEEDDPDNPFKSGKIWD